MPRIVITSDNLNIDVADGYEMIDLADSHNTSIIFGCNDGACGSCLIDVLEGDENLSAADSEEKELLSSMAAKPSERLACKCKVFGDVKFEISD